MTEDVGVKFKEAQLKMREVGGYPKLSKAEKLEYSRLKKASEDLKRSTLLNKSVKLNNNVNKLEVESVKAKLFSRITDGSARAAVLKLNETGDLKDQLIELRDNAFVRTDGRWVGYVQNFIDML